MKGEEEGGGGLSRKGNRMGGNGEEGALLVLSFSFLVSFPAGQKANAPPKLPLAPPFSNQMKPDFKSVNCCCLYSYSLVFDPFEYKIITFLLHLTPSNIK